METKHEFISGDCLDWMHKQPDNSVDAVVCSPPYAAQRDLGVGWNLKGEQWVKWALGRFNECLRISRGMVCWVIEGSGQQSLNYSAEPFLLLTDLKRMGVTVCKPCIYGRYSLPGKFKVLRNNYELILCATSGGDKTWSDPTACGDAPKFAPGGNTRPRTVKGDRAVSKTEYKQPTKCNAGNIIWCGSVGGGQMGDVMADNNEAPFPEYVAEVLVRTYCPPGGTVLDCFGGSGTTSAVARRHDRNSIYIDLRPEQTTLAEKRVMQSKNRSLNE